MCFHCCCVCVCVCSWLSALESTKWLQHLSLLLKAALLVVNAVDRDHRPVLVHCSDGWDRTPQIVALSKLLLDPYYRTIEVQMKTSFSVKNSQCDCSKISHHGEATLY